MEWINHLIPAIESYGSFGYWVIFLVSFFETLVFVGSFIPGSFVIIFYGFLAASGYLNLVDLFILATAGAVLGDALSYYLGTRSKNFFHEKNFLFNTKYLDKSRKFFATHGDKSIFWGRFIGIIKPFIPFVAGLSGMTVKRFVFWNVFSGIVWAISHLLVGYFFGGAFQVIETWTSRLGMLSLLGFVFFLILWFSIRKGEKALEYTTSFLHTAGWTFVNSYPVRWFYHRFPRIYIFISRRLNNDSFFGLPLTLFAFSFLIVILSLFDLTKDVLLSNPVVALDMKIENLLMVFRETFLVKIFLCFTALGEAPVVISLVLIATALFWLWKKRFYILSLWVAVAGSAASAYLAKMLINRDRPGGNIPVFTEHFFSFPSGHSALIITLFGFLTYCIWRNFRTWKIRVNSFFLFGALITLVGFSRLYLGVHFLSDVLGGYLIGFFWFLLGAALSEWQINRSRRRGGADLIAEVQNELQIKKHYLLLRLVTGLLITAEVFFIGAFIISFKPIFNSVVQTAERQVVVLDISDPLFEKYIPKFPENLTGDYQAPLNFIILAKDDQALIKAFALTGWQTADPVRAGSLFKILANYLRKSDYPTEPVAPLFWHGHPNDFAIERAVPSTPVGTRYQARFWRTDIVTEDGDYVYVGSAVLDDRAGFLILRSPARDLDVARDALFTDLIAGGAVARYEKKQFVDNSRGQYYEKGKYITDGRAYLIYTN